MIDSTFGAAFYDRCAAILGKTRQCAMVDVLYDFCYRTDSEPVMVLNLSPRYQHDWRAKSYSLYRRFSPDEARPLFSVLVGTSSWRNIVVVCARIGGKR